MRLQIWKILFLSCISIWQIVPSSALACAGGEESIEDSTFFDPAVIGEDWSSPLFYTMHTLHYPAMSDSKAPIDYVAASNLDDWDGFFQKKIPRESWSSLLYQATIDRLDAMIFRLKGKAGVPKENGEEPFMAYPDRRALISALFYVGFAKRVEPYATEAAGRRDWESPENNTKSDRDDSALDPLLASGTKAMEREKIPFLKQRYAFQILRLLFYRGDYEQCIKFFHDHSAEFSDRGGIAARAVGYAAGANYKLKQYAQANYLYSLQYDRFHPMAVSAFWSFHPQEESDWRQSLAMAKSAREKTVLWQMFAIAKDGWRGMREIYRLDPQSDLLPLLLVREVNRGETEAGVTMASDPTSLQKWRDRKVGFIKFVDTIADKGNVFKPYLWDLAAGHLHAMVGQTAEAKRFLDRAAARAPQDAAVRRQIRVSQLYAALQGMTQAAAANEPMLALEMAWLKEQSTSQIRTVAFFFWAKGRLAGLYRKKGDLITSLCLRDAPGDSFYQDNVQVERLKAFLKKPGKSPFEELVAGLYPYKNDDLVEEQALNALYHGQIEQAVALLKPLKTSTMPADPFVIHVRDCHDCDQQNPSKVSYTKTEVARRLAGLLAEARANPKKAAQNYFEMANAFYNITFYGNSREMYATNGGHVYRTPQTYDCSVAESYYRQAMELSKDREFKAKAAFMASKCELNDYFTKTGEDRKDDFRAGKWFALLKNSYSDTRYYQEIIKECGYFKTYVEHNSKH